MVDYEYISANIPPVATNVHIEGRPILGQVLTGVYDYASEGSNPDMGSVYKWYRSIDELGTGKVEIVTATLITYTVTLQDTGKFLSFDVTPKNGTTFGQTEESDFVFVTFLEGHGTAVSPFEISNLKELRHVSQNSSIWDLFFIQTDNIDATDTKNWNTGEGFSPIGTKAIHFEGSFSGNGFLIRNLYMNRRFQDSVGLFGYTDGMSLSNLALYEAHIKGANGVGGAVGRVSKSNIENVSIEASFISGNDLVGGVFGDIVESTVINSYSSGNIIEGLGEFAGGFAGSMESTGLIMNSYSTSWVKGFRVVGGFIGTIKDGSSKLQNCYNSGLVEGARDLGGIVGTTLGQSIDCYYDQETSKQNSPISEGKGISTADFLIESSFEASWNINSAIPDNVNPWVMKSGRPFLYYQNLTIHNGLPTDVKKPTPDTLTSYVSLNNGGAFINRGFRYAKQSDPDTWVKEISLNITDGEDKRGFTFAEDDTPYYIQSYVETLIQTHYGEVGTYEYITQEIPPEASDVTIEGNFILGGLLTGKYTYKSTGGFDEDGSNFVWYRSYTLTGDGKLEIPGANLKTYTLVEDDIGYFISFAVIPKNGFVFGERVESQLYFITPFPGQGTVESPYEISDISDLRIMSRFVDGWSKYFIQTDNIDASNSLNENNNTGIDPIGNSTIPFSGVYSGQGYSINNLFLNRPAQENVSLFGVLENANISDLNIVNADITGGDATGGMFGRSLNSVLKNLSVRYSNIHGVTNVGGLIGYADLTQINTSYSTGGQVSGGTNLGGLAGFINTSTIITNCFSSNLIDGQENTGGLVGYVNTMAEIINSYSSGFVLELQHQVVWSVSILV